MTTPIEMKDTFEGPFTVEGVIAFYKEKHFNGHARAIGKCFGQFYTLELGRLFEEMINFVAGDQFATEENKSAFSKAGFDRTFLDIALISEKNLTQLEPAQIDLIWSLIEGEYVHRFFRGKRINCCATAGLQKLLTLHRYLRRLQSIDRDTAGIEGDIAELGEIDLDYFSMIDMAKKLPRARAEQILEQCLPGMAAFELPYLITTGFFNWKMSVKIFLTLPKKSRKTVCKWLFHNRPMLAELERSILERPKTTGLFNKILCCQDKSVKWMPTRTTRTRDTSPTRK